MPFVSAFTYHRQFQPDSPAVFFPDAQEMPASYSDVDRITRSLAAHVIQMGVTRGDIVALTILNDFLHAMLLLTCARLGIVTMSGRPEQLGGTVTIKKWFCDRPPQLSSGTEAAAHQFTLVDENWMGSGDVGGDEPNFILPAADDLCRIMLTSGSTGRSKGVALTYGMVEERINACLYVFGSDFPNHGKIMCAMKLSSSLGFVFLFYALARGGFFCSDSAQFERITGTLKRFDVKALIISPYGLSEMLAYCNTHSTSLHVDSILTAGSLISPLLARSVRNTLCDQFVVFYGTTETGVISACWWDGDMGEVGIVVPGRRVEILGPDDASVPDNSPGTICIRATSGALPYYNVSELEDRRPNDRFCPGDIGVLDARGRLFLHGRADNIINAGGSKTTYESLEQAIMMAPGIQDCGIVCRTSEVGITQVIAALVVGPHWDQQVFLEYCEKNLAREFLPSKFVMLKKIPRNQGNKVDRETLSKLAS